jgi:hypothetical protein
VSGRVLERGTTLVIQANESWKSVPTLVCRFLVQWRMESFYGRSGRTADCSHRPVAFQQTGRPPSEFPFNVTIFDSYPTNASSC